MKYRTIVADPPWPQKGGGPLCGREGFGDATGASRKMPYETMTVARIADLSLPAADSAHLYLWTTNGFLADAYQVCAAWGFAFSTLLVWVKNPMGGGLGGDAFGIAAEYILFARRGSLLAKSRIGRNWFNWKRPYDGRGKPMHSAKPEAFYDTVEQVSPGPYLELFARRNRLGWDTWGDEALCHVEIEP
jgi:N6-adenosine-specific RNA methylase IME4